MMNSLSLEVVVLQFSILDVKLRIKGQTSDHTVLTKIQLSQNQAILLQPCMFSPIDSVFKCTLRIQANSNTLHAIALTIRDGIMEHFPYFLQKHQNCAVVGKERLCVQEQCSFHGLYVLKINRCIYSKIVFFFVVRMTEYISYHLF